MRHIVRGPAQRGAPEGAYKRFAGGETLAQAEFISAEHMKSRAPAAQRAVGINVQNPTYITTVWGYGYKWGF